MLTILSPAKALDFEPVVSVQSTEPTNLEHTQELVARMREHSAQELGALMSLSDKLAGLNFERYQSYSSEARPKGSKQALLAFNGDAYRDWPRGHYTEADFDHAQGHLRILSGLYGLLRPLDLIQPHRLEMGTRLKTRRGANLYAFWGEIITEELNRALEAQGDRILINLASNEYYKSVKPKLLDAEVISPVFKDYKNGQYKTISFFAKRARGAFAHHVLKERLSKRDDLESFCHGGYRFDPETSTPERPVFLRDQTS
jgi:hypothetical protein